jgi:hypothetical protein
MKPVIANASKAATGSRSAVAFAALTGARAAEVREVTRIPWEERVSSNTFRTYITIDTNIGMAAIFVNDFCID